MNVILWTYDIKICIWNIKTKLYSFLLGYLVATTKNVKLSKEAKEENNQSTAAEAQVPKRSEYDLHNHRTVNQLISV